MKPNSQSNTILIDEIGEKTNYNKKTKTDSIGLTYQTHNPSHEIRITQ